MIALAIPSCSRILAFSNVYVFACDDSSIVIYFLMYQSEEEPNAIYIPGTRGHVLD